jgi:hypothetical protein
MKPTRRAVLCAPASLLVAAASLGASAEEETFARIARARAAVRTMQGPFSQVRTIGLLATDVRSTGTLALVRPDSLRWELAPPDAVTFWVTPEGLAYRSAHGQGRLPAGDERIGHALDDLRTLLGGDLADLRDRWEMRILRDDPSGVELEAERRGPVPPVAARRLRLALAPDRVRPTRVLLAEGPRDRTAIEFGILVVNAPIDSARMRPT